MIHNIAMLILLAALAALATWSHARAKAAVSLQDDMALFYSRRA
jgi:hypothetical protein